MNEAPLPSGWAETILANLVPRAQYGISVPLEEENGIPVLRMNNLCDGSIDLADLAFSSSAEAARLTLAPNDVLFNRTNSIDHVGRTSLWRGELDVASFASYLVRLIPDPSRLNPEYLAYWLNLPATQLMIRRFATPGVHQVNINPTSLRRAVIRFPKSLVEQRRIVKVLSTIGETVAQIESLISKYQQVRSGMMQDLFVRGIAAGGGLRTRHNEDPCVYVNSPLGWIPNQWRMSTLGSCCAWASGGTPSRGKPEWWIGNVPWLTPKDMKSFELSDTSEHISVEGARIGSTTVPAGTVFVVVRGMILAHSFPVVLGSRAFAFNQDIKAIQPRAGLSSRFLAYWLTAHRDTFLKLTTEATHGTKRLDLKHILAMPIAIPSADEQSAVVDRLDSISCAIDEERSLASKLRNQRFGLMQDLLNGRLRVKFPEQERGSS